MLKVINLCKKMGRDILFKNITFDLLEGEKVAIVGPSGVGKSTLLRCIAGLESFDGKIESSGRSTLVFQEFYLFPHFSVWENITYVPLNVLKQDLQKTKELAFKLLAEFGLEEFVHKYPSTLSGGQKQRVAIIRAVMANADFLLMDEPTSSLDNTTTEIIAKFFSRKDISILFVSHDDLFIEQVATKVLELSNSESLIDVSSSYKLRNI